MYQKSVDAMIFELQLPEDFCSVKINKVNIVMIIAKVCFKYRRENRRQRNSYIEEEDDYDSDLRDSRVYKSRHSRPGNFTSRSPENSTNESSPFNDDEYDTFGDYSEKSKERVQVMSGTATAGEFK